MTLKKIEKGEDHPTRILIIEDNLDDSALLMRQLEKANLARHVQIIADGKEALNYLTESDRVSPELVAIFLDLKLPSLSGLRLLEKIRLNQRLKELSVIVMTSSNSPEDLDHCKKLGVTSYVQKPVTFNAFSKAVADNFHSRMTQTGSLRTSLNVE